jgi:hypothetical protein
VIKPPYPLRDLREQTYPRDSDSSVLKSKQSDFAMNVVIDSKYPLLCSSPHEAQLNPEKSLAPLGSMKEVPAR